MGNEAATKVHWSFWLIGVMALLWHVGGCMNYMMQMNPEVVIKFPATHRAIIEGRPGWATGGFAIGVFVGAMASLLLLLRKVSAMYAFILSLLGIIVTMVHTINIANSAIELSPSEIFFMVVLPIIVTGILIWYAKQVRDKGWFK